jgi:uncharacterized protein YndB with AHSA1/START domain
MAAPVARAEMLVRSPVAEVFNAFVDPGTITKFWLESTTGPLVKGARVVWRFMVPGAKETVTVTALDDQQRIAFDWSNGMGVTLTFGKKGDRATSIAVEVTGFHGGDAEDQVVTATEGFSIVLCDLKTLLESGRSANLVRDKAELIAQSL